MPVWTQDEAGPYQTIPYPGSHWQPEGEPSKQPHEYAKNGTAKLLTLFHPATGKVRVKGVTACPNAVLHEWLQQELTQILALLPAPPELSPEDTHAQWQRWQEGLQIAPRIGDDMPPLRLLLVLDNLSGHHTPSFVMWLGEHGIMPLYTPLGGSWLNMSESIQRIIVRRALDGEHPTTPQQIISWGDDTPSLIPFAPCPDGLQVGQPVRFLSSKAAAGVSPVTTMKIPLEHHAVCNDAQVTRPVTRP